MATFEVDVGGVTYEVDAPDESTAWKWANQTHAKETASAPKVEPEAKPVEPQEKSLVDTYLDWQKQGAKGLVSGAADIGNTLINVSTLPHRKLASAVGIDAFEKWNDDREKSLRDIQEEIGKSDIAKVGRVVGNIAGTAGVGNVLKLPAAAANLPRLAQALETGGFQGLSTGKMLPNALIRLAAGGAVGGASAGIINPEDAGVGTAVGAGAVALGNPLLKGVSYGAGRLYDLMAGRLPAVSAGKIGRDFAGDQLDAWRKANAVAPDDITAAQAGVDVPRFEIAALGEKARANAPTPYGLIQDKQEAARLASLDSVMPDLDAAVARRTAVTAPLYEEAMNSTKKVNANPVLNTIDKYIADNPKLDSITAPLTKIREDLFDATGQSLDTNVKSLSSLSQNIKAKIEAKNPDGTPQFDVKALTKIKEQLDEQIGKAEPKYAEARDKFAKLSAPVNQAKLIQEMKNTLVNSKGGERVTPFLNAMGTGEKSLFRRADQSPRFGSMDEVLTSKQKAAKDKIVAELKRDAEVSRRAGEASKKGSELVVQDSVKSYLPQFVDKIFTAAKRGMDLASAGINQETMDIISKGMQNGKSANEMLAVLPASEKNKLLNAMIRMERGAVAQSAAGSMVAEE